MVDSVARAQVGYTSSCYHGLRQLRHVHSCHDAGHAPNFARAMPAPACLLVGALTKRHSRSLMCCTVTRGMLMVSLAELWRVTLCARLQISVQPRWRMPLAICTTQLLFAPAPNAPWQVLVILATVPHKVRKPELCFCSNGLPWVHVK